jgi:signal transduction histidine kinase
LTTLIVLAGYVLTPERFGPGVVYVTEAERVLEGGGLERVALRHYLQSRPGSILEQSYRMRLPDVLDAHRQLAVYFPAGSARMEVSFAGRVIYSSTRSPYPLETQASRPQLVQLPQPLPEGVRTLEVLMRSEPGGSIVLNHAWIGPLQSLGPAFEKRHFLRFQGADLMALLLLITGATSFAFWLADRSYRSPLWFGLFCVLNSIAIKIGLGTTEMPIETVKMLHLAMLVLNLSFATLAKFILEKIGACSRAHDRLLLAYAVLAGLLLVVLYEDSLPYFRYALAMDALSIALGLYLLALLVRRWWQKRDSISRLLLGGVGLTMLLGIHSVVQNWRSDSQEDSYAVLYAPLPMIVTLGWSICRRYARSSLRWRALNRRLARRVRRRESEIADAYAQLASLEKEQAIRIERERFMRDMHDGLGSQLITSLRMAQRGALSQTQMQELLSECLDEMHFAIQSLKTTGEDVFVALADYRYRLEPRLQAGGIELQWKVTPAPALRLGAGEVLQTLRIVNEAVGNAIKHSGSARLSIEGTVTTEGRYALSIRDHGRGFAETARPGTGLESMRARARSMHATLEIDHEDGGVVRLIFPLAPAPPLPPYEGGGGSLADC